MIIPIRCFSCNKILADKYNYYINEIQKNKIMMRKLKKIYLINQDVIDIVVEDISFQQQI